MKKREKISLDAKAVLQSPMHEGELTETEMDKLKGGCFLWIGDPTTPTPGDCGIGGCAFACAYSSMR